MDKSPPPDWPVDPDSGTPGVNTFILVNTLLIIDLTGAVTCQNDGGYQHHNRYSPNALSTLLFMQLFNISIQPGQLSELMPSQGYHEGCGGDPVKTEISRHAHAHTHEHMHYLHLIIGTSEDLPGGSLTLVL